MSVPTHRLLLNAALAALLLWMIGSGLLGAALHHLVTRLVYHRLVGVIYMWMFENFRPACACAVATAACLLLYRHHRK